MTTPRLHHGLAAKFRADAPGGYHPLICHMADVAAVALAIWDRVLPSAARELLAERLGLDKDAARQWVAFTAGCHDLGKATRQFQGKDRDHAQRLGPLGLRASTSQDPGHGLRTAGFLARALRDLRVPSALASQLGLIAGGHHGRFLICDEMTHLSDAALQERGMPAWNQARKELMEDFRSLFRLDKVPRGELAPDAALLLAGLISVSDWIGSIEERFAYAPHGPNDLAEYFNQAQQIALRVIEEDRWLPQQVSRAGGFSQLFPALRDPRPLQRAVEELDPDFCPPGLVIIEAPMGEGKTEAALYLAHQWEAAGFRGMYVALPTQATANQLHGRVRHFLEQRDRNANLVLAHGGAWDQPRLLPSSVHSDEAATADLATVAAAEWFLGRKRALLAPYGVGTVDQALMAVLQVRHVFVRLFGLAAKPVIVDEVHAYDTYMTGLLERLLEWLGALRAPVILLSATLPATRRERLLAAYRRGAGLMDHAPPAATYPRITWTSPAGSGAQGFAASPRSTRTLELKRIQDDVNELVRELEEALASGGCAAVICNTVRRAQEVCEALATTFEPGRELGLFHARFLEKDRRRIEQECLEQFGPPEFARDRPDRYVLVATQVIEQSLDVDFDVMVTELAPIDLLLQRSGRLQRHDRGDRTPVLRILWPEEDEDGLPNFSPAQVAVYDPHILLRTWYVLRDCPSIHVPADIDELVNLVYRDDAAVPAGASPALRDRWEQTWTQLNERQRVEEMEAQQRRLESPNAELSPADLLRDPREEDEDLHPKLQALTRLADPSINVVLVPPGHTLQEQPSADDVRNLLDRSIAVSHRGLVHTLRGLAPPDAFQRVPALRRHRYIQLDEDGGAVVGRWRLEYSAELGLVVAEAEP